MGQNSGIEWTHHTFNPWRGCSKVSPGCAHCYAETLSKRNPKVLGIWGDDGTRAVGTDAYWQMPLAWDRAAAKAGERHRVFCASLADVFEDRPELEPLRDRLHALIALTPHLDWLLLTKRPEVALVYYGRDPMSLYNRVLYEADNYWRRRHPELVRIGVANPAEQRNRWLGVSVEDQKRAACRIETLFRCPAAVRFLSCEPLLGPVDLIESVRLAINAAVRRQQICPSPQPIDRARAVQLVSTVVDWVIVGGESGPGARPMHPDWARAIRDDCQAAGVAFHFKQWGRWAPVGASGTSYAGHHFVCEAGHFDKLTADRIAKHSDGDMCSASRVAIVDLGKKLAGRFLDGRTWDELPTVPAAAEVPA